MLRKRTVKIVEMKDGWLANGRTYSTAANALRAVKRQDKKAADKGVSTVTTIDWEPTTSVGLSVVHAIAG